jgi:hypothetical protein
MAEGPGGWWVVISETDRAAAPPASEEQPQAETVALASMSKKELYAEAKRAGISGRSGMNKKQLVEALEGHDGEASAPERQDPRQTPPATAPARDTLESRPPPRRKSQAPDRCAIAYRESDNQGEFQVVVTEADGSLRAAARSPAFPASTGEIRRKGAARAAHDVLVQRLLVCGWWPADSGGEWPELEFIRGESADWEGGRSLVTVVRDGGRARFVADELDSFGNPTPLEASHPFRASTLVSVRPSRQAKAAMKRLLARLELDGWKVAGQVGDSWYAISLSRRRGFSPSAPDDAFG